MNMDSTSENKKALYNIALIFLSINATLQVYQSLVPLILQKDFHISELTIGIITGGTNLIVCLTLFILNKIKPSLSLQVLSSVLLSIVLAIIPFSVKQNHLEIFVLLFCSGMMTLSFTKVLANDFTLQIAPAGKENSAMALTKIASTLGGLVALIIMFLMNNSFAFYAMVLLNLIAVGGLFYTRKTINGNIENNLKSKQKKVTTCSIGTRVITLFIILLSYTVYDAMLSTFSRYATNVWNMNNNDFAIYQSICLIAAFIAYIPIGKIANEENQKKWTLFGLIAMAAGLFSINLFPTFHYAVILPFIAVGVGWAAIAVNIVPILVHNATPKETSRLVGFYSIMSNISLIIAPTLSGIILEFATYRVLYCALASLLIFAACLLFTLKSKTKS